MQNPQHRPNRRDRQSAQVKKAVGVLAILCVVVVAMAHFYLSAKSSSRPIDEKTFCPTDNKGMNTVAILIDRTDSFTLTQQAAIRDRLNQVKDDTGRYDLIEIYSVEPTQTQLLKPEFSMCNPGRGEEVNEWTGNPHMVEERWKTLFADPLQHIFDNSLSAENAAISPIMESIQSIVVTRLGTQSMISKKNTRKLIIVSDLLQYMGDYSQYKPLEPFAKFSKTPYYQNVRADLNGISFEIWYVRRQKTLNIQGQKHVDFWRDYISDQGGSVDKVWFVPGT
ncbi:MAG TPA: hypothetical protein VFR09_07205 [Alphaproteobacteria bacterium]|nr:hypothetical protein [Alphaproteobacteria bacterium]